MTRLSVNINKIALLRNARGENFPDILKYARDCEQFGADGITVHPRPDERHIRYSDIPLLKESVKTEFNIEGNPIDDFMDLVLKHIPDQVTLVPDAPDALTSNTGWDTIKHWDFLKERIAEFKKKGIRVSIFMDPVRERIEGAAEVGADRIELYTGPYASKFAAGNHKEVLEKHRNAAKWANESGLGVNAGHDLNLDNISEYAKALEPLHEVSIGHALTVESIYLGLENVIKLYKERLTK